MAAFLSWGTVHVPVPNLPRAALLWRIAARLPGSSRGFDASKSRPSHAKAAPTLALSVTGASSPIGMCPSSSSPQAPSREPAHPSPGDKTAKPGLDGVSTWTRKRQTAAMKVSRHRWVISADFRILNASQEDSSVARIPPNLLFRFREGAQHRPGTASAATGSCPDS
jgi:hypothetical protein